MRIVPSIGFNTAVYADSLAAFSAAANDDASELSVTRIFDDSPRNT